MSLQYTPGFLGYVRRTTMSMNRAGTGGLVLGALLALGAAGCATYSSTPTTTAPRGVAETTSDAAITAKVKTAFAADDLVKATKIDVDTMRGVVTLNGTVSSRAELDKALSIARNTAGVTSVRNNLKVTG
jgi:hyperosmotically inducible periplasmic protein